MLYIHTFMFIEIWSGNGKNMQPSATGILVACPGRQELAELGHGPEILSGKQGGSRA